VANKTWWKPKLLPDPKQPEKRKAPPPRADQPWWPDGRNGHSKKQQRLEQRSHGFHPRVQADPGSLNAGERVYALTDGTAVKVGKRKGHPEGRLRELPTGNARPLTLLA
jgi:hypothetical protein